MVNISGFLSYAGKARINASPNVHPMVMTGPFHLQHLIYQVLVYAFKATGPGKEIQISIFPEEKGGLRLTFSGLGELYDGNFPADSIFTIAKSIEAKICMSDDFQAIDIVVPETIERIK